jgi:hypothetical protein
VIADAAELSAHFEAGLIPVVDEAGQLLGGVTA